MKSKSKKNKGILKKTIVVLAEKSFFASLLAVFLAMGVGTFLFYNFIILPDKKEPAPAVTSVRLESAAYQEILNVWEGMKERFEKADLKNYLNFFADR
jgi:hypothetical protein